MTLTDWHKKLIEGLLLVACLGGLVAYLDHRHALQEVAVLAVAKEQNAQSQQVIQQLQADKAQLQLQFNALQGQIQAVQSQALQQIAAIKRLPPAQLATQTQQALGVGTITQSPTQPGNFDLDTPALQATLQQSIQLQASKAQLLLQESQIANLQKTLLDDTKQLAAKDSIIKNDEEVVIPQLKKEVSRSKRKWFVIGVVTGWFLRTAATAAGGVH